MALIVAMAIFLSVSAYAQSDETCIAYMEADAEYESSVNGDKDVGESAWAYVLAVNASNSAVKDSSTAEIPFLLRKKRSHPIFMRLGGLFVSGKRLGRKSFVVWKHGARLERLTKNRLRPLVQNSFLSATPHIDLHTPDPKAM